MYTKYSIFNVMQKLDLYHFKKFVKQTNGLWLFFDASVMFVTFFFYLTLFEYSIDPALGFINDYNKNKF